MLRYDYPTQLRTKMRCTSPTGTTRRPTPPRFRTHKSPKKSESIGTEPSNSAPSATHKSPIKLENVGNKKRFPNAYIHTLLRKRNQITSECNQVSFNTMRNSNGNARHPFENRLLIRIGKSVGAAVENHPFLLEYHNFNEIGYFLRRK